MNNQNHQPNQPHQTDAAQATAQARGRHPDALTEIAFVLDRSGSMQSCLEGAIAGFNGFLKSQQTEPGRARFTLVKFDDQYEVAYASEPIGSVAPLDTKSFVPRGSTALLDAIGKTIDDLGKKLAAEPEAARPALVIFAILTDGLENASTQFTWKEISDRIAHQRDVYQWEFAFLGANQDAIATAANLSISSSMASAFVADNIGTMSASEALHLKLSPMRKRNVAQVLSFDERENLASPLAAIAAKQDAKQRRKGK